MTVLSYYNEARPEIVPSRRRDPGRGLCSSARAAVPPGARNASDKIIQHNGGGTLYVKNFLAESFGKLYRSCGNCSTQNQRKSEFDTIVANGKVKVEVALARGKEQRDKRRDIANRDAARQIERELKSVRRSRSSA